MIFVRNPLFDRWCLLWLLPNRNLHLSVRSSRPASITTQELQQKIPQANVILRLKESDQSQDHKFCINKCNDHFSPSWYFFPSAQQKARWINHPEDKDGYEASSWTAEDRRLQKQPKPWHSVFLLCCHILPDYLHTISSQLSATVSDAGKRRSDLLNR